VGYGEQEKCKFWILNYLISQSRETNKARRRKQKVIVKSFHLYYLLKKCPFQLVFLLIISMK